MEKLNQSIIIPTRNRHETALFAIESALQATYQHLQIVVTDNSDDELLYMELKKRDWLNKVTYHKTEKCLSMRDNWERGLDLSTGELISVIGDDDAVMPEAFTIANFAFNKLDIDALHSDTAIYKWESYPFRGRRQFLSIPLAEDFKFIKDPKSILRQAMQNDVQLGTGPGLYYGFLSREFLNKLKAKRGRWIVDPIPDFDSGYAVLMYAKSYVECMRPLFVQGHSGKSNSAAFRFASLQTKNMEIFTREVGATNDQIISSELETMKGIGATIFSCQLRILDEVREVLNDQSLDFNRIKVWNYLVESMQGTYDSVELIASMGTLESIADAWKIPKEERKAMKLGGNRPLEPKA